MTDDIECLGKAIGGIRSKREMGVRRRRRRERMKKRRRGKKK